MSVFRLSRRWLLSAGLFSLTVAALPLAGKAEAADLPKVIRFASPDLTAGTKPFSGTSTITLAHVRGALEKEFEKDGVKVEWSFFKGAGPAVNEAFANKQIDFAYLGDLASIIGRAGGLSTRFIYANRGSNGYLGVQKDSDIAGLKDLEGKRVALFRGTADQLSFDRALAEAGLSERDLQVINLDWAAGRAALVAGQVDAAWGGSALLVLAEKGQIKVAASTKDLTNRQATTQSGVVVAQDFIDAHPEAVQRVVNVLVNEAKWASEEENRAAFFQILSDQGGLPLSLIEGEFAGDDLRFRFNPRLDDFVQASYADSVAKAKELGLVRKAFDTKEWLEPRFVEAAIEANGLKGFWGSFDTTGKAVSN